MALRTPADPQHVAHLATQGSPSEAVLEAWINPGPVPAWHRAAQQEVRDAMPVLAAALDRMAAER